MHRIVRLTLAAVVLAVVLAGASLVAAFFILDDEDYLHIAELALEEALGWTLEVRGPVSVDRSLTFALTGHDAVLSRGQTRLAAAKQATFRLDLPALLRGQFQFEVDVQEPDVRFTIDKAGKTSWNFEQFAEEGRGFPLEVVIAGIRTGKGQAFVREEASGRSLELDLDEFVFREAGNQYEFGFNFVSAYEGHDFRADGKIRVNYAFDTLSPDFVIDLLKGTDKRPSAASPEVKPETAQAAEVVAARLGVSGKVEDPFDALRTDLGLSLRMEDLSPLREYVDQLPETVASLGPLTANGRFTGSDDKYELEGIDARLGEEDLRLEVTGSLTQLPGDPVAQLKARVQASDLAQLSSLLGTEPPAVSPLHVAGDMELREDSIRLTGLKASLGKSDLAGSVALHTNEAKPRVIVDLSSERLQLDEIFLTKKAGKVEEEKAAPSAQPDRVFSDKPIPLDWLNAFNAKIRVQAKHLVLYRHFTDVRYSLDVDNGTLELNQALTLGDGSMDTRLRIDNRRSPPSFSFSDKANGVPLTDVLDLPEGIILGGKVNGQARLEGRGNTPRAVAASLNGMILFEMGEARLVEAGLKMVSADLLSGILDSLSPSSSEKGTLSEGGYTDYRCGVFGIGIKDGMVRSDRAIALESEKFNIGGNGYVDLRKETIGLAIRPKAKTGLGLSVGTLLGGFAVGGTLSSPKVQLAKVGLAVTATVGPLVHFLGDWVTVNDFTCANTLKRIRKQQKTKQSSK